MSITTSSKPFTPEESLLFQQKFGERVRFEERLAPYLAYRVGGPAECLVFPANEEELLWISEFSQKTNRQITIIGNGTNLLVSDRGIRGITISLLKAFQAISLERETSPDTVWVRSGGGVEKSKLLEWAILQGLTGLEFSSGVPGTIGGGIFMNAGTKYGCYGDILRSLRLFDFSQGVRELSRHEAHFGYREQTAVKGTLVTSVVFELKRADSLTIRAEVERIIAERAEKQPLDYPSCGSTFKNPPEGLSAGRLIERAGLKGLSVGGAEVSTKHANFILNKGNATAEDIITLIRLIKAKVKETFQVQLECEVIILGEVSPEQ